MPPDLKYMIGLAPKKAIEYLKSKGYKFSWNWFELWQEAHTKAFTVAKVMRQDILDDIREMVTKSLEEGITFREFQKELEPKLKAKGWWGQVSVGDGETIETVQLGSPWRLKTIYRTNLQTSYMAGRYKDQIDNVDNRPYWQYVAVMDARTRPAHKKSLMAKYSDMMILSGIAFIHPTAGDVGAGLGLYQRKTCKIEAKGLNPQKDYYHRKKEKFLKRPIRKHW